jgi:hypothetical protein
MMNVRSVSTAKVVMRLGFLTGAVPGQDFIDLKSWIPLRKSEAENPLLL